MIKISGFDGLAAIQNTTITIILMLNKLEKLTKPQDSYIIGIIWSWSCRLNLSLGLSSASAFLELLQDNIYDGI